MQISFTVKQSQVIEPDWSYHIIDYSIVNSSFSITFIASVAQ